jgi:hypothetical protein
VRQRILAPEQHLPFIGEVPEERSLGQACPLGDLCNCGLVESALGVELKGRLLQAAARIGLPPAHPAILGDDRDCHRRYRDDSN